MLCNGLNLADNKVYWILHFSDEPGHAVPFLSGIRGFTSHHNFIFYKKKLTNKYTKNLE